MTTQYQSEINKGVLMELRLLNGQKRRYQNFNPSGSLVWDDGHTYEFLPIDYTGTSRSLEFSNAEVEVMIPNRSITRDLLISNDGLRKAVVVFHTLALPSTILATDRLQVMQSTFDYANIEITLSSPIGAANANITTVYFSSDRFPELPAKTGVQIG